MLIDAGLSLYSPTFWGPKKFLPARLKCERGPLSTSKMAVRQWWIAKCHMFQGWEASKTSTPSMLMFTMLPRFWPIPASKVDIKVWNDVALSANRITTNPMVYHHGSHYCLFFYEYPTVVTAGFPPLQIPKDMWTLPEGPAWESPGAPAGDVHLMVKEKWPNMEIME